MPVITKPAPGAQGGGSPGGPLSTRRGTIAAAGVVALLAGLVLFFALQQYRSSMAGNGEAAKVLVANGLIPRASSGDVLPTEDLVKSAEVRADQLEEGALTDPAALRGQVSLREILPGQQLTAADFAPSSRTVMSKLGGGDRAVAIEVPEARGVGGAIRTGDRVDVIAAFNTVAIGAGVQRPVVKTLMQNVLVLAAGSGKEGEATEQIIIRASADFVPELAFASENGKLWAALRPGAGARDPKKELVGLETVLLGERIETARDLSGGDDD